MNSISGTSSTRTWFRIFNCCQGVDVLDQNQTRGTNNSSTLPSPPSALNQIVPNGEPTIGHTTNLAPSSPSLGLNQVLTNTAPIMETLSSIEISVDDDGELVILCNTNRALDETLFPETVRQWLVNSPQEELFQRIIATQALLTFNLGETQEFHLNQLDLLSSLPDHLLIKGDARFTGCRSLESTNGLIVHGKLVLENCPSLTVKEFCYIAKTESPDPELPSDERMSSHFVRYQIFTGDLLDSQLRIIDDWISQSPSDELADREKIAALLRGCYTERSYPVEFNDLSKVTRLPDGIIINSDAKFLNCLSLCTLENVEIRGYAEFENCPVLPQIPETFYVHRFLNFKNMESLHQLPQKLNAFEAIGFVHCPSLKNLPENLQLKAIITLYNCPIESIPNHFQCDGFPLDYVPISVIHDDFKCRSRFSYNFGSLKTIHNNFRVEKDLQLIGTALETIGNNFTVFGPANVSGSSSLRSIGDNVYVKNVHPYHEFNLSGNDSLETIGKNFRVIGTTVFPECTELTIGGNLLPG